MAIEIETLTSSSESEPDFTLVSAANGLDNSDEQPRFERRAEPSYWEATPRVNMFAHRLAMATAVIVPFVGCVIAVVLLWQIGWMGWQYLAMLIGGWMLTNLGITVGFHRLLTHKSFDTYRWVQAFWMFLGSLSVQGSPLVWCAVHRRHHAKSDKEGDPHSPVLHGRGFINFIRGFYHSHVGWLFNSMWTKIDLQRYVPDLAKDQLLRRVDRNYYMIVLASLLIPAILGWLIEGTLFGAFLGLVWGGLVRIFMTHHMTWSINSMCHLFGSRDFEASDESRNNIFFGVFVFGEGWHNNHHAFPSSARHGLKWWQFDASWIVIRTMQLTGLAWNVRLPSAHAIASRKCD